MLYLKTSRPLNAMKLSRAIINTTEADKDSETLCYNAIQKKN